MEDLEGRLARIGYRPVRREAECWRVAQLGAPAPIRRVCSESRSRDPAHSHALRLWLDRLGDVERPMLYRIRRATRG
jgi:hypothetical protein